MRKIKIIKVTHTDDNYDCEYCYNNKDRIEDSILESEWQTVTEEEYLDIKETIMFIKNRNAFQDRNTSYVLLERINKDTFNSDLESIKNKLYEYKEKIKVKEMAAKERELKEKIRQENYQKNKEKMKIERLKKQAEKLGLKVE